ncbi:MAG: glucose-6-phosphate dehydrogenase assembly protein OpcA [Actinomycetia bacterium]|nr:glucose-6-phosphate dehydrogenase assembly protein OpcA [Actinomycetes bacterium]
MIIPLYDTTANEVADKLVSVRREGGAVALSRVLTLLVPVGAAAAEDAIKATNHASMEHPCRVIVLVERDPGAAPALDAEIRVGGDAGASEVVVLRLRGTTADHLDSVVTPLLLPDVPIVTWWPDTMPTCPSTSPLGRVADRRVTDSRLAEGPVAERLAQLRACYAPGDTDLAWTRLTWWRAHLAAILDQPPYEVVTRVVIYGHDEHPSPDLLAAWLGWKLHCPVRLIRGAVTLTRVDLERPSGTVTIERPDGSDMADLTLPGAARQRFPLPRRPVADCLSEELRRLDPDPVYGRVLADGLDWIMAPGRLEEVVSEATIPLVTRSATGPAEGRTA